MQQGCATIGAFDLPKWLNRAIFAIGTHCALACGGKSKCTFIHFYREGLMAHTTTDATFEQDVLKSDKPVLVDFWAHWCGPCRMVGPIIEDVARKKEGEAHVFKINVDENPLTASRFGITGIPTVIVFRDGKVVQQFVGVQPEQTYLNSLQ
jgi:thioredoxin 1